MAKTGQDIAQQNWQNIQKQKKPTTAIKTNVPTNTTETNKVVQPTATNVPATQMTDQGWQNTYWDMRNKGLIKEAEAYRQTFQPTVSTIPQAQQNIQSPVLPQTAQQTGTEGYDITGVRNKLSAAQAFPQIGQPQDIRLEETFKQQPALETFPQPGQVTSMTSISPTMGAKSDLSSVYVNQPITGSPSSVFTTATNNSNSTDVYNSINSQYQDPNIDNNTISGYQNVYDVMTTQYTNMLNEQNNQLLNGIKDQIQSYQLGADKAKADVEKSSGRWEDIMTRITDQQMERSKLDDEVEQHDFDTQVKIMQDKNAKTAGYIKGQLAAMGALQSTAGLDTITYYQTMGDLALSDLQFKSTMAHNYKLNTDQSILNNYAQNVLKIEEDKNNTINTIDSNLATSINTLYSDTTKSITEQNKAIMDFTMEAQKAKDAADNNAKSQIMDVMNYNLKVQEDEYKKIRDVEADNQWYAQYQMNLYDKAAQQDLDWAKYDLETSKAADDTAYKSAYLDVLRGNSQLDQNQFSWEQQKTADQLALDWYEATNAKPVAGTTTPGTATSGAQIGANYLKNYGAITGYGSKTNAFGLDVDLNDGTPVYSPIGGKVLSVTPEANSGGWGNTVVVQDINGNKIRLSHLQNYNVKAGDMLSSGDVVGLGGHTGNVVPGPGSNGSHLDITITRPNGTKMSAKEVEQYVTNPNITQITKYADPKIQTIVNSLSPIFKQFQIPDVDQKIRDYQLRGDYQGLNSFFDSYAMSAMGQASRDLYDSSMGTANNLKQIYNMIPNNIDPYAIISNNLKPYLGVKPDDKTTTFIAAYNSSVQNYLKTLYGAGFTGSEMQRAQSNLLVEGDNAQKIRDKIAANIKLWENGQKFILNRYKSGVMTAEPPDMTIGPATDKPLSTSQNISSTVSNTLRSIPQSITSFAQGTYIKVKDNKTGAIGRVPISEYNPTQYTKVQ